MLGGIHSARQADGADPHKEHPRDGGADGRLHPAVMPPFYGEYCIEAGRSRGAWSLRVSPWTGSLTDDDVLSGPQVVDLRDQTDGPAPLSLLRALLSGQAA